MFRPIFDFYSKIYFSINYIRYSDRIKDSITLSVEEEKLMKITIDSPISLSKNVDLEKVIFPYLISIHRLFDFI